MRSLTTSDEADTEDTSHGFTYYFPTILLLAFLYTLQGIIFGLTTAMPFLIQRVGSITNYGALATFSLASWPPAFKLLWTPFVESVYSVRFGRRKSWIVPIAFAIGLTLLIVPNYVDWWLGRESGGSVDAGPIKVLPLTATFCWLVLLTSTLDIAVDGLSLAELPKRGVGWISACSIIGVAFGHNLSYVFMLCVEIPSIWSWIYPQAEGMERVSSLTSGFLRFWGISFLTTAFMVALFKREEHATMWLPFKVHWNIFPRSYSHTQCAACIIRRKTSPETLEEAIERLAALSPTNPTDVGGQIDLNIEGRAEHSSGSKLNANLSPPIKAKYIKPSPLDAYLVLLRLVCLKVVIKVFVVICLMRLCFAPMEAILVPFMVEEGFPVDRLALLSIFILPVRWVLPLLTVRWTKRPALLQIYTTLGLIRIFVCSLAIPLVYTARLFKRPLERDNSTQPHDAYGQNMHYVYDLSGTYYGLFVAFMLCDSILGDSMVFFVLAFVARISDPQFGGSYMTLFATCASLASSLWNTALLHLMSHLTRRKCVGADPLVIGRMLWFSTMNGTTASASGLLTLSDNELRILGQRWMLEYTTCFAEEGNEACRRAGGLCTSVLDGFFLEFSVCLLIGMLTFPCILRPLAIQLDALPSSAFTVRVSRPACCTAFRWRRRRRPSAE